MRRAKGPVPGLLPGLAIMAMGCQPALPVLPAPGDLDVKVTGSAPTVPGIGLPPLEQALAAFAIGLLQRGTSANLDRNADLAGNPLGWNHPGFGSPGGGHDATALIAGRGSTGSRVGAGFGMGTGLNGGVSVGWGMSHDPNTPLPGWGNRGWGPGGAMNEAAAPTSTWAAPAPGRFNLDRGAGQIGGWGLDAGFFTIPQDRISAQMRAQLDAINQTPGNRAGAPQTNLDQTKFPFLRPVQGPLVPPVN